MVGANRSAIAMNKYFSGILALFWIQAFLIGDLPGATAHFAFQQTEPEAIPQEDFQADSGDWFPNPDIQAENGDALIDISVGKAHYDLRPAPQP